jgi:hypothetical protein
VRDIRWLAILAVVMVIAALARGYGADAWDEATVYALGAVVVAVLSLHSP